MSPAPSRNPEPARLGLSDRRVRTAPGQSGRSKLIEEGLSTVKKYLLVALGVIAVSAMLAGDALGVAAFLTVRAQHHHTTKKAEQKKAPSKPTISKALFVQIPQFVVTIPASPDGKGGSVYLQLSMSFLTESKRATEDFSKLIPIIKSGIISHVMSSGMSPDSEPMKMKHKITAQSLALVNSIVSQSDSAVGDKPFLGAYITTFITQ